MRRHAALAMLVVLAAGCATRGDVVRLETQLAQLRQERNRQDSLLTVNLAAVARMLQSLYDTLAVQQTALTRLRGDLRVELYNIQQQLVAVQELTGQSQQRLSELRGELAQRSPAAAPPQAAPSAAPAGAAAAPAAPPGGVPEPGGAAPAAVRPGPTAAPAEPNAEELYEVSIQQLRRGSPGTARSGLAELLRRFPTHARAADAEYFIGEAWAAESRADSAAAAYRRVLQRHPQSPRAASALYKLGLQALAAGRVADARADFERLVRTYPNADEASLARERLRTLPAGPTRAPTRRP